MAKTRESIQEKHLNRQIEFIRDSDSAAVHQVIVRMRTSDQDDVTFMQTVAEAMLRRGLSTSARDVLPPPKESLKAKDQGGRRRPSVVQGSLTATGRQWKPLTTTEELRAAGLKTLEPLIESDVVREGIRSVANAAEGKKGRPKRGAAGPTKFWTSSSAVVQVRDEDLKTLISSVPNIADVLPNRRLFVPPVVVPKQVPRVVEDNQVSVWGVRRIGALEVWGAFDRRGEDIMVGLLDTGVDANHPDLKGKVALWAEFDQKGKEVNGSKPRDSDKHGTHCAGTIVGGNASGSWIGVAPHAKLAAAMVLNGEEGGTDAQVLAGMQWAIDNRVDVISMSLGGIVWGPETPPIYTTTIWNALKVGIPVVTAIGNEGNETSGSPGNDFLALAVGATDYLDRAAGFSGGRTQVIRESRLFRPEMLPLVYSKPDLSAPGVAVYSSVPKGKWEAFNGTSMATPHVAGAIALLLSATKIKTAVAPNQKAFVIQDLLTGSAEEMGEAGQNHRFGFGRIDILRAIGFAGELGYV